MGSGFDFLTISGGELLRSQSLTPWLILAGLGAFHGVNPAMGWLFAVALGLHRQSRAVVLKSLAPIAIGHALAVAPVAFGIVALGAVIDQRLLYLAAGLLLIGWAAYHQLYGARHRVRVGMRTGLAGLVLWSFVMASGHGAGLMLAPALLHLGHGGSAAAASLAAVGVHTLAMLLVTGGIAVVVYEWAGVAFLRRGWINLDRVWAGALLVTGVILVLTALAGPPEMPRLQS
jgi:hypothetical protein